MRHAANHWRCSGLSGVQIALLCAGILCVDGCARSPRQVFEVRRSPGRTEAAGQVHIADNLATRRPQVVPKSPDSGDDSGATDPAAQQVVHVAGTNGGGGNSPKAVFWSTPQTKPTSGDGAFDDPFLDQLEAKVGRRPVHPSPSLATRPPAEKRQTAQKSAGGVKQVAASVATPGAAARRGTAAAKSAPTKHAPASVATTSRTPSDAQRLKADTLMFRAHRALNQERLQEALRLATAARQIETTEHLAYAPEEERPSAFVVYLQRLSALPEQSRQQLLAQEKSGAARPADEHQPPRQAPGVASQATRQTRIAPVAAAQSVAAAQ